MISFLASLISGGLLGTIGSIFKSVLNFKKEQLAAEERAKDRQFELDKMDKDREMRIAEANANIKTMETETQGKVAVEQLRTDSEARIASYAHDAATYSGEKARKESKLMLFVDFCRGMTRPGLTMYLVVSSTALTVGIGWVLWELKDSIELALSVTGNGPHGLAVVTKLLGMAEMLILLVVNMTSMAVSWWFGERNKIGDAIAKKMGGLK